MNSHVYRYCFVGEIAEAEIESLLVRAIVAIEHLHGAAATRLDARHLLDAAGRQCVIDATSPLGLELNKLFAGSLTREFGLESFTVTRLQAFPTGPAMHQPAES